MNMAAADEPHTFRVAHNGHNAASVELDGEEVAHLLSGYEVMSAAGQDPQIVLHLGHRTTRGTVLDLVGTVKIADDTGGGVTAVDFLAAIDPGELERTALNRVDLDPGEHGGTKAILAQLQEWASGRA